MSRKKAGKHEKQWEKAVILNRARLNSWPGVISVAIGRKEKGGKLTGRRCVKIYVRRKRAISKLATEPLPKTAQVLLPTGKSTFRSYRLPTDVVELRGLLLAQPNNQPLAGCNQPGGEQSFLTVPSGAEIGMNPTTGFGPGSLGCIVKSNADGTRFLMTAGHVVSSVHGSVPARVMFQPQINNAQRRLGKTQIGLIDNDVVTDGYIDAVLIAIETATLSFTNAAWDPRVPTPTSFLPISTIVQGQISVHKVGARTGYTRGEFSAFHKSHTNELTSEVYRNILEFKISADNPHACIADKGDSGSVVISRSGQNQGSMVGLLFAVSLDRERAFVIPFERLAKFFKVSLSSI
jgi:hypothetical protein